MLVSDVRLGLGFKVKARVKFRVRLVKFDVGVYFRADISVFYGIFVCDCEISTPGCEISTPR